MPADEELGRASPSGRRRQERLRLQPLLDATSEFVPGLPGRIGAPEAESIVLGRDNRLQLEILEARIAAREPEAGAGYWRLRSWAMLTWQPAALTVLGVHRCGLVPSLERLGQSLQGPALWGFQLPEESCGSGAPEHLIALAGRRLRGLAEGLLEELRQVTTVKPELARRLLADRVLGVLLRLEAQPAEKLATAWLAALGLQGKSGVMAVADGGARRLALDRRACCLEYRAAAGAVCESCPKLSLAIRRARLRAAWRADVPAV